MKLVRPSARRPRWLAATAIVTAVLLIYAIPAAAEAAPAPAWTLTATSQPTNFQAGVAATGASFNSYPQYLLIAENVGGAATSGPVTITGTLPAGVTTSASLQPEGQDQRGNTVTCTIAAPTVTCVDSGVTPLQPNDYVQVSIPVDVAVGATGTLISEASVSGGGALAGASATAVTSVSPSQAAFGFLAGTNGFRGLIGAADGEPVTLAGSHPFQITFNAALATQRFGPILKPAEGGLRDLVTDLPPGVVVNPAATPVRCTSAQLTTNTVGGGCPAASQIGTVTTYTQISGPVPIRTALYNMVPPPGVPSDFAFDVAGVGMYVHLKGGVRTGSDYGLSAMSNDVVAPSVNPVLGFRASLWGNPSDSAFNGARVGRGCNSPCSVSATSVPLLTMPTSCSASLTTALSGDSWLASGIFKSTSHTRDQGVSGCWDLDFLPDMQLRPTSRAADSPSGMGVDLALSQAGLESFDGTAQAHLKRAVVALPVGLTFNPAAADGLDGCTQAEMGLVVPQVGSEPRFDASEPRCGDGAKVGDGSIDTPLLEEPLAVDLYVADPDDNPFHSLLAGYLVARGSGVMIKLPARFDRDPETGQITAVVDQNPQLPFSNLRLRFKGGERGVIATPSPCGVYEIEAKLSSWSAADPDTPTEAETATQTSSFAIDRAADGGPCEAGDPSQPASASSWADLPFVPGFRAGAASPVAGGSSSFAASVTRQEGDQDLRSLRSIRLPEGLLGRVADVALCDDAAADAGGCPAASRVGHVQVGAGAGSAPLWVPQAGKEPTSVSLTGPYRGAPYGLSIMVPAQAGPFDLGKVVVRSALHVDERTARLSTGIDEARVYGPGGELKRVLSGEMPTILEGVPLKLRELRVIVDRDGFVVNPTDCSEQQITAEAVSVSGKTVRLASRFQVGDCARLGFSPRLVMRLTGKGRTRTGAHPGLKSVLTQGSGQANIARAQVTLPKSVVLDPRNSTDPALVCDYDKGQASDCSASSVIGKATARSPLLRGPLTGNVHLVQGIRLGAGGRRIRTLPTLLVKLRGEVAIDLRARTTVKGNRLVTVFDQVPDARVSRFDLQINGGKKGILVITRTARSNINICKSKQTANIRTNGQNGRRSNFATTIKTPCAKKANRKAKRKKK